MTLGAAPELLYTAANAVYGIDVAHGGHEIRFREKDPNDEWAFRQIRLANQTWAAVSAPSDAPSNGSYLSMTRWSHDQDMSAGAQITTGDPQYNAVPAGYEDVKFIVADQSGNNRTGTVRFQGDYFTKRSWSVAAAFPQRGDSVLFAVNRLRGTYVDLSYPCVDDRGVPAVCYDQQESWATDTTFLYLMSIRGTTLVPRLFRAMPDTTVYWIGFSDVDSTAVMALGAAVDSGGSVSNSHTQHWCAIQYWNSRLTGAPARSVTSTEACTLPQPYGDYATGSPGVGALGIRIGAAGVFGPATVGTARNKGRGPRQATVENGRLRKSSSRPNLPSP